MDGQQRFIDLHQAGLNTAGEFSFMVQSMLSRNQDKSVES